MGIDLRSASPAVRSAGRAFLLSAILLALALSARTRALPVALQNPSAEEIPGLGFRITLGQGDDAPRDWSGEITLSGGRVSRLEGWHFALEDRIEGQTWKATSKKPVQSRLPNPANPPLVDPLGTFTVGIQAVIDAPGTTKVSIRTTPGDFSFQVKELVYGRPLSFLDGSVVVERQPVTQRVTAPELEDDDPAVAVTRDGTVWMAWIAYRNRSDEVLARSLKSGRWSDPVRVSPGGGDFFRVTLAEDAQGRIWFVWSAQETGNWDLQARSLEGGKWSAVTRLTQNPAPDTFHSLAASKNGNLALAWMSFREGQSDVYLKGWDGTRWSDEIKVSDSAANDWEPSVAVDSQGRSWVAWDSYERGSYNVLLRSVAAGQPGDLIRVTDSPRYHARASVTVDPADRVWVAWEESEANWGKDYGYLASPTPWQASGNPLYRSRSVRIAVLDNKVLKTPERDLMEAVPAWLRQYTQMPQLLSDPAGRIWVLLRVRSFVRTETADVWASGGRWNVFLTAYAGGSWLPVISFPDSVARNYVQAAGAIAPDGKLWAAWPTDGRLFANPPKPVPAAANLKPNDLQGFGAVPQPYDVFTTSVDPSGLQSATTISKSELVLLRPDLASAGPVHPDEEASVRRIRSYEIRSGGKTYRIYRGDMHRHTDISADGAGDGSVMDLFRYAMDAARMDYAMVTDHNSGFDQEYSWWRIEKVDDLFHVPGHFTTLFGYERSLGYPNGHRNLAFAQRGVRTLPAAPGEQPQQGIVKVNSGSVLYPYLRQNRGIAFGHTSHTGMGTDWRDNDPDLEPLVEIYQGMRTSAEYEGAPKAPTQDRPATHQGGFQPAGFVWNAWAKGWKLGVQASSDHISTHISYSCLISEDGSREGLMNAMRRRHTYAATDNIILDVRMKDGSAEYLQGDIFVASGPAQLTVKVIGTQPLKEVRVVKNNRFVYDQKPGVREAEFSFSDADAQSGESYYYVRVLQEDGQVAWSSPIWVTRKK